MVLLNHLMNLLLSELEVQDDLLGLLIRERVAIVKQSQDQMDQVLVERQALEHKLEGIVNRREMIFRAIEDELKLPTGHIALDNLSDVDNGELQLLGESLSTAFTTIQEMRQQNVQLRKQSIAALHQPH